MSSNKFGSKFIIFSGVLAGSLVVFFILFCLGYFFYLRLNQGQEEKTPTSLMPSTSTSAMPSADLESIRLQYNEEFPKIISSYLQLAKASKGEKLVELSVKCQEDLLALLVPPEARQKHLRTVLALEAIKQAAISPKKNILAENFQELNDLINQ